MSGEAAASLREGAPAQAGASRIGEDLGSYIAFGSKLSGGDGDHAVGAWLERRLSEIGFQTRRQAFAVPRLELAAATLRVGDLLLPLHPQPPWRMTRDAGIEGRLASWPRERDVRSAIAVIVLPFARWSTFGAAEIEPQVRAALAAGAAAVVIVTTGPSGEALGLNVPLDAAPFAAPVAVLAPADAARLEPALAAGAAARLTLTGEQVAGEAFNVVGRLDRGAGRWLVLSTPRSGWFGCAGERGPGVAAWLDLAGWAALTQRHVDVLAVSTSGHERGHAGARLFLGSDLAPPADATALWLHLGANLATRDWHDLTARATPLPSADPQRYLAVEPQLLASARQAFRGLAGLERPYSSDDLVDGELVEIMAADFSPSAGVFGAHRFHHAPGDDHRCVGSALTMDATERCRRFIAAVI